MAVRTSDIDPTVPPDNVQVDKATLRSNFEAAEDEINELLRRTGYAWMLAMRGLTRTQL